ncbi:MAG TPA: hypothetical protein VFU55_06045 [Terracidiphilus sp.]|nr:hypothetical protein [Terracidiphilus sp.]
MKKPLTATAWLPGPWIAAVLLALSAVPVSAQQTAPPVPQPPPSPQTAQSPQQATHITPEQARQLFGMVDTLLKFASDETGLPIRGEVKRQLTTREDVAAYLRKQMNDDQDAKRFERSELVLKKFGLLDRDFDLKPFLLQLLGEQIEAYYDPKTKTVNMLDWVSPDQQKPVLAHELTHALQDQHVDLVKWSDQTPPEVSTTFAGDNVHIQKDEMDAAREAVTEGQATAVMVDNMLKPMGRSLIKDPEVVEILKQHMNGSADSPILARAPLLISESLMFPYREGLSFEQDVWMDKGRAAAFAGALDHPPSSSWEIINPRMYEQGQIPPVPLLPNIHPLLDPLYKPYDIGQVGQLDVQILTRLFGGESASRDYTPAWDGGIYWAGQLRSATPAEQATTRSIAIFYLSRWRNAASADNFAHLYASELGNKYSGLSEDKAAEAAAPANGDAQQVFSTNEGPVVITMRDKMVFVAESFPLDVARKLTRLVLDSQGTGALKMAALRPAAVRFPAAQTVDWPPQTLSGGFVRFFARCGVMKAAVYAAMQAANPPALAQPALTQPVQAQPVQAQPVR